MGKSLLFNQLLGTHRAIVTDIPGTTRELLRDEVMLAGVPCQLIDSPGLLDFYEEVPFLAQIIQEADLLLFVVDGKEEIGRKELDIHQIILHEGKFAQTVLVVNKLDSKVYTKQLPTLLAPRYELGYDQIMPTSAMQREGIEELREKVFSELKALVKTQPKQPEKAEGSIVDLAII